MKYYVEIKSVKGDFPIDGLNELLNGRIKDYRTKKYRNSVKIKNDAICRKAIRSQLKGIKITTPIVCTYNIYAKNKRHDRSNLYSSVEKSFLDALQQEGTITSDGWNFVGDSVFNTFVDAENPRILVQIREVGEL